MATTPRAGIGGRNDPLTGHGRVPFNPTRKPVETDEILKLSKLIFNEMCGLFKRMQEIGIDVPRSDTELSIRMKQDGNFATLILLLYETMKEVQNVRNLAERGVRFEEANRPIR